MRTSCATPAADPAQTADASADGVPGDIAATLQHWRDSGADRLDPVRFRLIEAMARRALAHDGAARQRLDARLADMVRAYAASVALTAGTAPSDAMPTHAPASAAVSSPAPASAPLASPMASPMASPPAAARPQPRSALAGLVEIMARGGAPAPSPGAGPTVRQAAGMSAQTPSPTPLRREPELIDFFRDTWTRVSVDRQLRESLERVPENAGPLHSDHLIHRSLKLMRETSPGYLEHFMRYVDAMSWLERLAEGGTAAGADKETPKPGVQRGPARKPARPRSRT